MDTVKVINEAKRESVQDKKLHAAEQRHLATSLYFVCVCVCARAFMCVCVCVCAWSFVPPSNATLPLLFMLSFCVYVCGRIVCV